MIQNMRGSVTDYAGRCLGPINWPWPVAGLSQKLENCPRPILQVKYSSDICLSSCKFSNNGKRLEISNNMN